MTRNVRAKTTSRETPRPSSRASGSGFHCLDQTRPAIGSAPPLVNETLKSPGRPLAPELRAAMEDRLGHDFSRVRVHADDKAAASALSVGALAFTYGKDLVFARGQYRPETEPGRELLAHELGHVVQEGGFVPFMARAVPATAAPGQAAVKTALEGDDDDVRALTESPVWPSVTLSPADAAQLIIHLLTGFTGDDDEIAGLQVLRKMLANTALDATLESLQSRGKFDQLLDDYHGEEYRQLLDLLSASLKTTTIKATFLDYFVALWWVKEHEEKAIVVLLDLASPPERYELLTGKGRYVKLRSAIDTEEYALRFEKVMKEVIIQKSERAEARLMSVFTVEYARKSWAAGTLSDKEIQDLIERATEDLADELLEYRAELEVAVWDEKTTSEELAKINDQFHDRLNKLVETKSREFQLELKYNLEFNRSLDSAFRRVWTKEELEKMDKEVLSKIPPEILHANPKFKKFLRQTKHPDDYAGLATGGEEASITLMGEGSENLNLNVTSHELGHQIHNDDPSLLTEFMKLSDWKPVPRSDFTGELAELLPKLDADRASKNKYSRHKVGDYYYIWNRYEEGEYYRYSASKPFITAYARTHPKDDFADSIEEYFTNPKNLANKCPGKYDFLHQKVFTEYRLRKVFELECRKAFASYDQNSLLLSQIQNSVINPLEEDLKKTLANPRERSPRPSADPVGLKGAIDRRADPYLSRLRVLLAVLKIPLTRFDAFSQSVERNRLTVRAEFRSQYHQMATKMTISFKDELMGLIKPTAEKIGKGEKVDTKTWPEVQALSQAFQLRISVMADYVPYFDATQRRTTLYGQTSGLSARISDPKKRKLFEAEIEKAGNTLIAKLRTVEEQIKQRMNAGVAFDPKAITDPNKVIREFSTKVNALKKKYGIDYDREYIPEAP